MNLYNYTPDNYIPISEWKTAPCIQQVTHDNRHNTFDPASKMAIQRRSTYSGRCTRGKTGSEY